MKLREWVRRNWENLWLAAFVTLCASLFYAFSAMAYERTSW